MRQLVYTEPRVRYVDTDLGRCAAAEAAGVEVEHVSADWPRKFERASITVAYDLRREALLAAITSTAPYGTCTSAAIHREPIDLPLLQMYSRGITFHTSRRLTPVPPPRCSSWPEPDNSTSAGCRPPSRASTRPSRVARCPAQARPDSVMTGDSSPAGERYDEIGRSCSRTRREDPRIARAVHACLGGARTVINVGSGTGSYEPRDRAGVAVEPSTQMIAQRGPHAAPVLRGVAEALPFAPGSFDAAMALLTVHHWSDPGTGICELRRVADRQVVLYFEPLRDRAFWGLEYFPEAVDLDTERNPPGEDLLRALLDMHTIHRVLLPRDCVDGFGTAYWARPEALLDPDVQAGIRGWRCCPKRRASLVSSGSATTCGQGRGTIVTAISGPRRSSTAASASR